MSVDSSFLNPADIQQQAYQCLVQGEYSQAVTLYEQAIETSPTVMSNYWHLGLALLLQGQEEEAQATWMFKITEAEPDQIDQWSVELFSILKIEAERRESLSDYDVSWVIRQHMREIFPEEINNLLYLIKLSIKIKTFTGNELVDFGLIEILQSELPLELNTKLLFQVLQGILESGISDASEVILQFIESCLPHIEQTQALVDLLMLAAIRIGYAEGKIYFALHLTELCFRLKPDNSQVLVHLSAFYRQVSRHIESIEIAKHYFNSCQAIEDKCFANYLILKGLINAGGFQKEAEEILEKQKLLMTQLIEERSSGFTPTFASQLLASSSIFFYLSDEPKRTRNIQNQLARICQFSIKNFAVDFKGQNRPIQNSDKSKAIKVGYLSSCLKRHSVGWLARWIFQYYNRDKFQFNTYLINQSPTDEFAQKWFIKNVSQSFNLGFDTLEIAEKIAQDEIDILVDLDSMTLDVTCEVMALKPAPIQVTWLGFDASALPAVDYFIADPYVLPEDAQAYYTEKIWRLSQTYVAVDGFEVGVPTLRREDLEIPQDAIVYFSAQNAHKRNFEMARLQMKILKEVSNSYFLIKGSADRDVLQNLFTQIAEEEGIEENRLRFLPEVASEEVHRANLGIADVVLDTYPYNGATTTLETLWMGIPLVTRVGEQFSSRNSYTMMMNAGITEGLAWTDEAYVEWGVRLGQDAALRQQIAWRLRQSRQTSPLWNAKQFTREMEKAYQAMWLRYLESI